MSSSKYNLNTNELVQLPVINFNIRVGFVFNL